MYKNSTAAVNALRLKLRVCDVVVADRRELCAARSAAARVDSLGQLLRVRARTQAALETLSAAEATRYQLEAMQ